MVRRHSMFEHITPNWFASIMGTGIVANAAATLPLQWSGLQFLATGVWIFAATALVGLSLAFAAHWILHRDTARGYARHPVVSLFYGAVPMALLTVGSGTLLAGRDIVGEQSAFWVAAVLWGVGTVAGLATCVCIPFRLLAAEDRGTIVPLPAWLVPVVPPMVSATGGALLAQHVPDGGIRATLLVTCYALFFVSLAAGSVAMTFICCHLWNGGTPPLQAVPTVWITLGLVGQSITAANVLAADTGQEWLRDASIGYGVVVGAFGATMFTAATVLTIRAARHGLSFSLTWWSFTFPVGTCVTGATAMGTALRAHSIHVLALGLFAVLVAAWVVVTVQTVRGSVTGRLFDPA